MPKPLADWNEDDVLALPAGENDSFERKGSRMLDLTLPQVNEGHVLDELAKQLSAFANTGGGQIIYGITNAGTIDNGGIAPDIKGSTKEWLEDVIPILTEFEILGFNVYEIQPKASGSSLAVGRSLFVIDVPDSDRAPHQSKRDLKYFVRLGGKSRPASHRLIEDIRNRARHAKLEVHSLRIIQASHFGQTPRASQFDISLSVNLQCRLRNAGRVRAANACLAISATAQLYANTSLTGDEFYWRRGQPGTLLMEIRSPLYPSMEIELLFLIQLPLQILNAEQDHPPFTVGGVDPCDARFWFTIFADSAPPERQEFKLNDIDPEQLRRAVDQAARQSRVR